MCLNVFERNLNLFIVYCLGTILTAPIYIQISEDGELSKCGKGHDQNLVTREHVILNLVAYIGDEPPRQDPAPSPLSGESAQCAQSSSTQTPSAQTSSAQTSSARSSSAQSFSAQCTRSCVVYVWTNDEMSCYTRAGFSLFVLNVRNACVAVQCVGY